MLCQRSQSSKRLAWIAAIWWVCSPAIAQKADVEIGILTCTLDEPSKAPDTTAPNIESQVREAVCTFKPKSGAEETYAGIVQGVSLTPEKTKAVIWIVKADRDALSARFAATELRSRSCNARRSTATDGGRDELPHHPAIHDRHA